ncbi:MAG TPA: DUF4136 domain-containing protein [Aeromonadales bacterium]|nr:DUF4136 domain-containing protein [Aeromonadales bacterium]
MAVSLCYSINFRREPVKHYIQLILMALVVMISACSSTPRVNYDKKANFSFDQLKSYAILQSKDKDAFLTLDDNRAINAIKTILNQKGYEETSEDKADFIVSYQVVNDKKYRMDTYYDPWGYRPFWYGYGGYGGNYLREYQVGTLIIDLIDPKAKEVIWRGSTSSRVKKNLTPVERASRIQDAVSLILKVLP